MDRAVKMELLDVNGRVEAMELDGGLVRKNVHLRWTHARSHLPDFTSCLTPNPGCPFHIPKPQSLPRLPKAWQQSQDD